jgi:hypothetical protein
MASLTNFPKEITMQKLFLTVAVLALALFGCTAIQEQNTDDTEQLLAAAGFQMKLADTPEKLAHLQTMTQRKVVPHDQDGETRYVYADAEFCRCLYAGDQTAYQRYEKIAVEQNIAQMNENAAMNWDMWGPGWGWY